MTSLYIFFLFFHSVFKKFFGTTWGWAKGPILARQMLYHLIHPILPPALFHLVFSFG
jgi:hypothetical protein